MRQLYRATLFIFPFSYSMCIYPAYVKHFNKRKEANINNCVLSRPLHVPPRAKVGLIASEALAAKHRLEQPTLPLPPQDNTRQCSFHQKPESADQRGSMFMFPRSKTSSPHHKQRTSRFYPSTLHHMVKIRSCNKTMARSNHKEMVSFSRSSHLSCGATPVVPVQPLTTSAGTLSLTD